MRQVVVGWDGTDAAANAAAWALRHNPDCAELRLVQVEDASRPLRDGATRDPEEGAEQLRAKHPGTTIAVGGVRGPTEHVLVGHTAADVLLVLGAQDPADRLYGHRTSLAYRVAAEAGGRVAVVPVSHDHGRGVVVGLVKPGESPTAVRAAADEAVQRHQRLIGVHAWRRFLDIDVLDLDPRHRREADVRHAKDLDAMLAPALETHPGLEVTRRVVHGRAEDVLRAESKGAALLVLGRDDQKDEGRRRGTMQTVLLTSLIPVLVVPPAAA